MLVSECSEDMWLLKNGSNIYLSDYRMKETVIICAHIHISYWSESTKDLPLVSYRDGQW